MGTVFVFAKMSELKEIMNAQCLTQFLSPNKWIIIMVIIIDLPKKVFSAVTLKELNGTL